MRSVLTLIASAAFAGAALAAPIGNPVAVFSGLDKITGRIITFDVLIDETVQFGALQITPRACNTRPPTEPAQTIGFIEVDEITLHSEIRRRPSCSAPSIASSRCAGGITNRSSNLASDVRW